MKDDFIKVNGKELLKKIKELIHQGNIRKIIIKNEKGKTYMEIPLTIGIVGAVLAPLLASIGALAAMATSFTIQVIKKEEKEIKPIKKDNEK